MFSEGYERGTTALSSVSQVMRDDLTDGELATLARSEEVKIRAAVAERVQTPLTSLLILATDAAPSVRAAVARNPRADIPLEVRESLARDASPEVLFALVRCESVPDSILAKLQRSSIKDLAAAAKERAKAPRPAPGFGVAQVGLASS